MLMERHAVMQGHQPLAFRASAMHETCHAIRALEHNSSMCTGHTISMQFS